MTKNKWGFLRKTSKLAKKAGLDKATELHRTGLEKYLKVIFPKTKDWIHNKEIGRIKEIRYRQRPDYRSESLRIIIEFDGIQHYNNPELIEKDIKNTKLYESLKYKVVRIPYFIQLTNKAVKTLFDVDVSENLFDEKFPSLSIEERNTPAYLCPAGVKRMAEEFKNFPDQYKTNIEYLQKLNDPLKSGVEFLTKAYNDKNTST